LTRLSTVLLGSQVDQSISPEGWFLTRGRFRFQLNFGAAINLAGSHFTERTDAFPSGETRVVQTRGRFNDQSAFELVYLGPGIEYKISPQIGVSLGGRYIFNFINDEEDERLERVSEWMIPLEAYYRF